MVIIALGTKSEQKISYVREILNEIELPAKLIPIKVESNVSEQPISEEETKKGSYNRAKSALKQAPEANIGLGIEVGYHKAKLRYKIFCYTTLIDRNNYSISSKSHEFVLPDFHDEKLKSNKSLGKYVKEYFPNEDKGPKKYIREMIICRKPFIIESIRSALLEYYSNN